MLHSDGFSPTSYFNRLEESRRAAEVPGPIPAPSQMPRALFASTTSGYQGNVVEIKSGQLRSWWHDIDDALTSIEEGNVRGIEDAVRDLSNLRDHLDDVVRSANGASRSDRTAG